MAPPKAIILLRFWSPSNESDSTWEDAATEKQFRKEGPVRFPSKDQNPTTSPLKVKVTKNQPDLGVLKIN